MRPKGGHPYYELGGSLGVTREQADFCRRRVLGLLVHEINTPLPQLLGNAYALGMADAAQYFAGLSDGVGRAPRPPQVPGDKSREDQNPFPPRGEDQSNLPTESTGEEHGR